MERVVEGDDGRASGRLARDLDGVLDGLGAGVREHGLLRGIAGREVVQALGELDVGLVGRDVEAGVGVQLGLSLDRGDDLGRAVSDVQHGDAGREVDEAVPVDVLDDGAGGPRGDDRMEPRRRHARRRSRGARTTRVSSDPGSR